MRQSIAPLFGFCKFFFVPGCRKGSETIRQNVIFVKNIHILDYSVSGCMERRCGPNPAVGYESLFLYNFKRVSSIERHGRICYYTHKDRQTDQKIMNFQQEAYVL